MKILLRNADWLIRDYMSIQQRGSVLIQSDKVISVGSTEEVEQHISRSEEVRILDCSGCIVMPGLINSHTHVYEIAEHGLGKNLTMEE
jgi:5-methylthioadenosine/S-adenosylhomocysteine deaminase